MALTLMSDRNTYLYHLRKLSLLSTLGTLFTPTGKRLMNRQTFYNGFLLLNMYCSRNVLCI